MSKDKYIIGIDLGTTNCTMGYTLIQESHVLNEISLFSIPQITAASTQSSQFTLPSFLYFPLEEEISSQSVSIDWDPKRPYCVGLFARERGAELPERMVASAKSWLCHCGIDRRAKILPNNGSESAPCLISPLEACAEYLKHLKEVWNLEMKKNASFEKQIILITVPASFDPSARQLVQEAAELAGYPEIILLEEPQAAFYAWLYSQGDSWRKQLTVGDTLLVVDIGGGTTDFSLIRVKDESGTLGLERVAVGDHLLLGGDNIDLTLAYLAKNKLEQAGHNIDEWQMQKLIPACRQAKEKFFGEEALDKVEVILHGRGSRLIGGSLKTTLTKAEVSKVVLDGFFPLTKVNERSISEKRSGLQQIGLPYVQDPRISCQLSKFLSMTGESDQYSIDQFIMPTAVLFNGGTLKSEALRNRLIEVINGWAVELNKPTIKILPDCDYDFAVSRGAVYYGLAREGKGIRIKGGTSRSYYVGIESAQPAVPGIPAPISAMCVVPFGMEEGTEQVLQGKEFALTLGEPATFRFFSCSTPTLSSGKVAVAGTIIKQWKQELQELHPIETILEKDTSQGKIVHVSLTSKVNELGVLELWCVSKDARKWKLQFDLR